MRWFKHMTNARNDEFVRELLHKFGSDGAWAWFATIEVIAETLKANEIRECGNSVEELGKDGPASVRTWVKSSPRYFSEQTLIPVETLKKVYKYIKERRKGRFVDHGDLWTVGIPKVLAFMDEHSERVFKETMKTLGSRSGAARPRGEERRGEGEERRKEDPPLSFLSRDGVSGGVSPPLSPPVPAPSCASPLMALSQEFTVLTGRGAFTKVRAQGRIIRDLEALLAARGLGPCMKVMRDKIAEHRARTGKPPGNLGYFVPVFRDDHLFSGNGKAAP